MISATANFTPVIGQPNSVINAPLNTDIISSPVSVSGSPSPIELSVTNGDFRVNGGSWMTAGQVNSGDSVEYRTQVQQDGELKNVEITFDSVVSNWTIQATSCFGFSNGTITSYDVASCGADVVIPSNI